MLKEYILRRWIVNKVKSQLPVITSEIVRERGCTFCPYYAGRVDRQSRCMLKRCSWYSPEEYHPAMKQLIPLYESKMEKAKSKYEDLKNTCDVLNQSFAEVKENNIENDECYHCTYTRNGPCIGICYKKLLQKGN